MSTLPDNCHVDPNYPNDAICTSKTPVDIKCDTISKQKNDVIINTYYTMQNNNAWSCNNKSGNCNIDQCKNIVYYNGDPCVILSNSTTNTFINSQNSESVICINSNNKISKYNYVDSRWLIKKEPQPSPPSSSPINSTSDTNITNYADDDSTANIS